MTESVIEEARAWFRKNWSTILVLMLVFLLALFLRSYFAFEPATRTGFVVSGGSDAYYHKRVIDYVVDTGHHLVREPLLAYPLGSPASGRPPLYDWSVAVSGIGLSPLFENVDVSVWYSFIFSTALWGALTVFPLYFLTKGAFGKRAGLLAAFLLAVMPAHIQRSPLTNGDHDAYVLFFVVVSFYFFMRALKTLEERKWVSNWFRARDVAVGLSDFFRSNRKPVLYSLMSAISLAAIALAWKGFGYAIVILLLYFLLQILLNRFTRTDSTGVLACFAITVGVALLLSFPWYLQFFKTGDFSTPAYMYIGALIFGAVLVTTRDYPWSLVIPSVFAAFGIGIFLLILLAPTTVSTFLGGAGYFIRTKAYATIAEAQPPTFSQQAMSFGALTYFLALVGLVWAAVQLPKRLKPDYLFIIVWTGAAIFMAISAARFIFNGGPAFAAASAWVVVIVVEKLDLRAAKKVYDSLSGRKLHALRKSIKVRHVAGALFIAFLVVMPNVWYGVDASIPFEEKRKLDEQIYETTPFFLRPANYRAPWFLGAFGYSLPLKNRYWPAAWSWLRQQDADILPYEDRPAFLSWWDYGFEAIQEGKHPTVADNFLHGYQTAGNFIAAQDENTAIAYLSVQLLQGDYLSHNKHLSQTTRGILERYGFNPDEIETVMRYPTMYIDEILRDPDRFGPRDSNIQAQNALLIYLKQLMIEHLDTDKQADMYHDIRAITGKSIRYFAVDSRMFPFSGRNPGIFYAPIKLSDHRIKDYKVRPDVPIDFFDLRCVDANGMEHDCEEISPAQGVAQFKIVYKDMFWNSMFYRAYIGYSAKDLGETKEGIPGLSGEYANSQPLQGWSLGHFKLVYRTAYYNPYPPTEYANHTEAWTAINLEDALRYQQEIQAGLRQGVVDPSPRSGLTSGVVFLKYYDGAIVRGKVTVDGVTPLAGVRITVRDEFNVPHYVSYSDSDGDYQVLAPFGDIDIIASTGKVNNMTLVGETILNTTTISVSDDQAMRAPTDANGDGVLDYNITQDLVVQGGGLTGTVFIDENENGFSEYYEPKIVNADVVFKHKDTGEEVRATTSQNGFYRISGAFPGDYEVTVITPVRTIGPFDANVTAGDTKLRNIPLKPATVAGLVKLRDGTPAEGASLVLLDEYNGTEMVNVSGLNGVYEFKPLLPGNFTLTATWRDYSSLPMRFKVLQDGDRIIRNVTLLPTGKVTGRSQLAGNTVPNVAVVFRNLGHSPFDVFALTDDGGFYTVSLPEGKYLVYALHDMGGQKLVCMKGIIVRRNETAFSDINLEDALKVSGNVVAASSGIPQNQIRITFDRGDSRIVVITDTGGNYSLYLPKGTYNVWVSQQNFAYLERREIAEDTVLNLSLGTGISASNTVYEDYNLNGVYDVGEEVEDVEVSFSTSSGETIKLMTDASGKFIGPLVDQDYSVVLSKRGYSTKQLGSMTVADVNELGPISITSLFVSLHGSVSMDGSLFTQQPIEIRFESVRKGAISETATASKGEYQLSLHPGIYNVVVDVPVEGMEGARYQLLRPREIDLWPTDRPTEVDFSMAKRFFVSGNITLGGIPVASNITFSGKDTKHMDVPTGAFSLYLQGGDYTVIAAAGTNETEFMSVKSLTISEATTLDMKLYPKTHVTGRVVFEGRGYMESLSINFSSDSGELIESVNTTASMYSVDLPPGSYVVECDKPDNATINGMMKYVRYQFSGTLLITEGLSERTYNIELARVFDNVTLSGTVQYEGEGVEVDATVKADSQTAVNTTFRSQPDGTFSVKITPGRYSIYIHKKEGHLVYLGPIEILRGEDSQLDIQLTESYKVSGIASYREGLHNRTSVSFLENGSYYVESNDDGYFEAYLPPGTYEIDAETTDYEDGKLTAYTTVYDLDLDGNKVISLVLEKEIDRGVELKWNAEEKREIKGGESVTYVIGIENTGNVPDEFDISGLPPRNGWTFEFKPARISLGTGNEASGSFEAIITAPEDALVDHGPVKIMATSVNDQNTNGQVTVEIDIVREWGIEMKMSSDVPTYDGNYLDIYVNLTNTGNGDDTYYIGIINLDRIESDGWEIGLRNESTQQTAADIIGFEVAANSTSKFGIRLVPPKVMMNETVTLYAYSLKNRGNDALFSIEVASPTAQVDSKHMFAEGPSAHTERVEDYVSHLFVGVVVAGLVAASAYMRRRRRK